MRWRQATRDSEALRSEVNVSYDGSNSERSVSCKHFVQHACIATLAQLLLDGVDDHLELADTLHDCIIVPLLLCLGPLAQSHHTDNPTKGNKARQSHCPKT